MTSLVIWRYVIPIEDQVDVELPYEAEVLWVSTDRSGTTVGEPGDPVFIEMWCLVDPNAVKVSTRFYVRGTGDTLETDADSWYMHLGTVMTHRGRLVWHVFQRIGHVGDELENALEAGDAE